ncbi:unnamed protein product [Clonostachys rosea f. rosea IK726]|uniref:Uncharacterized protein n=1 Tax=Clonostachys rosea f. rosea IK726 TaxID=1349383 RepID=A0ACA9TG68_BIOOC|nr:unnamed protein product [Clonostachys rosea f. rosea IK726]
MAWANARDIRVVIKGTGHDLNGRSSGAYALSIWTHHLQEIAFNPHWIRPAFNSTENVVIAQTGNTWGRLLKAASEVNRTVVSGQDGTVGLGGFIGGGGHGPLSSSYGLSADQILQATVVTADGSILIANDEQNQDLLWAIRGGGPGSYGVVIEYVMRTFPLSSNVVVGSLSMSTQENGTQEASWDGLSTLMPALPDLMDSGLTGFGIGTVSQAECSNTSAVGRQADISMLFYLFNSTTVKWTNLLSPLQQRMAGDSNGHSIQVILSEPRILSQYLDLFDILNPTASSCGDISLSSSRLLGRRELNDIGHDAVKGYLKRITTAQVDGQSARLVIGLQGGQGPRNVEDSMRGGLTSAWRDAYLHVLVTGSSIDFENTSPRSALQAAADWTNAHKETVWAEWAPDSGSYINEANPFNVTSMEPTTVGC